MTRRAWGSLVVLLLAPLPQQLGAQVVVTPRAVFGTAMTSAGLAGTTERVSGWWAGLALDLRRDRFMVSAAGLRGRQANSAANFLARDLGEFSLAGRFDLIPELAFEVRYAAAAQRSPAGRRRWDSVRGGVIASRALGDPQVRGFAGLAVTPMIRANRGAAPEWGWSGEVGVTIAPNRGPVSALLAYRVERYEFPVVRSEQFEALTLSLGVPWRWH